MRWRASDADVSEQVSSNTYVNVIAQYRPSYRALEFPVLSEAVGGDEHVEAVSAGCSGDCGVSMIRRHLSDLEIPSSEREQR